MLTLVRRTILAGLTGVLLMAPLGAQQPFVPFVVGVWGQGEAIIPFADFDGERWRTNWREPGDRTSPNVPLPRIPAAWWGRAAFTERWEILEPDGHRRDARLVGTTDAGLGSNCSGNIGLRTDVPKGTYTYGRVLAASRPGVVEPVTTIRPGSADWRAIRSVLPALFRRHHTAIWKGVPEDFAPELTRPSVPVLDKAFLAADSEGEFLYFESRQDFQRRSAQPGEQFSFITGWLWRRDTAMPLQLVELQAMLQDPDFKGTPSFAPLGVVRDGSRRFWLGTLGGYAYSALAVVDVRRHTTRELVRVEYGGC
jgi:hypothetical protein